MRKVTVISMVVLAISLSFSVIGCLFIMNQGNVSDIITIKPNVNAKVVSEAEKDDSRIEFVSGPTYQTINVVGKRYTYNWTFNENEITSMPTELSISREDAIDVAKQGVKDLFQYEMSNETMIEVNISVTPEDEMYYIVLNNHFLEGDETNMGEDMFVCTVNAITAELVSVENRSVEGAYDDEDELWRHDEEGNEIGFNLPDFFTDSTKLEQLKEESEGIATSFIEQLGIYDMSELTYLKTEAYETMYPWTLEAMFAKGEQEIVSVSILANNLKPYQYRVFTREPLISY